jgi:hypothetical protein
MRFGPTDEGGRRTLWEVMQVPHCLQTKARGILGRGREIRFASFDVFGGAGSLRGVGVGDSLLVEGKLLDMAVREMIKRVQMAVVFIHSKASKAVKFKYLMGDQLNNVARPAVLVLRPFAFIDLDLA